jgi:hypothetical protein
MSNARLCATKYNMRRLDEVDSRESPKRSNCGPDAGMDPLPSGCNQEATPVFDLYDAFDTNDTFFGRACGVRVDI